MQATLNDVKEFKEFVEYSWSEVVSIRPPDNTIWTRPLEGVVKSNVDAAIIKENHLAFGGGLLRDSSGRWITGFFSFSRESHKSIYFLIK